MPQLSLSTPGKYQLNVQQRGFIFEKLVANQLYCPTCLPNGCRYSLLGHLTRLQGDKFLSESCTTPIVQRANSLVVFLTEVVFVQPHSLHVLLKCAAGQLPSNFPIAWRGDSCLQDGSDNGVDLSGGLYDAGDHVKFGLPMAFTATLLSWSVLEYGPLMDKSNQLTVAKGSIRWVTDYLIKAHTASEEFYYQVSIFVSSRSGATQILLLELISLWTYVEGTWSHF